MLRSLIFPFILITINAATQNTLTVHAILNNPDAGGIVRFAFCPNEEAFDSWKGCDTISVAVVGRIVDATFTDVPQGICAVRVIQDVNSNGKLDTSWLGWPKEPYGFSNNAPVNTGPPPFHLAAWMIRPGENVIRVALR